MIGLLHFGNKLFALLRLLQLRPNNLTHPHYLEHGLLRVEWHDEIGEARRLGSDCVLAYADALEEKGSRIETIKIHYM